MNNKTNMEEDIKILESMIEEYENCSIPEIDMQVNVKFRERQAKAIENILADRERLEEKANKYDNLEKENTELRKRPVFYYDNNRNTYVWCCRCTDSNMSLHMFLENGEIQGYASEHYDKWIKDAKEVKQVDVCEFMHKFVKPLIIKANKYDSLVKENEKLTYARDWYFEHTVNKIVTPEMLHKILRTKYISKDEIKEKIQSLNKQEKEELKGTKGQDRYYIKQKYMYQRNVLQKLLDTEK